MADWFFDSAATGNGSGDTPGNAGTNIVSFWSYVNSAWTFGDRMWFRRSSVATWNNTNSNWPMGRTGWNTQSDAYSWMIGWPKSGQLFYSDRPGSARSLGWDTDTNTVYSSIDMAAFIDTASAGFSRSHGFGTGLGLANFVFVNCGVQRNFPVMTDSGPYTVKNNIHWVNYTYGAAMENYIDLTITTSCGAWGTIATAFLIRIDKLTITASCNIGLNLFAANQPFFIKEMVVDTNSMGALCDAGQFASSQERCILETVRGTKWKADVTSSSLSNDQVAPREVMISNYFGEGPRTITGRRTGNYRTPISGTALVNSVPAMSMTHVQSGAASANGYANFVHTSGGRHAPLARVRDFVTWSNTMDLVLRWPFLQIGSANLNVASTRMPHFIHVVGLGQSPAEIAVSSGFTWSGGSATGVGSAWVAIGRFRAAAVGSGFADLMLSMFTPNNDDLIFFGRVEANSA
jgi:hypothetical protein